MKEHKAAPIALFFGVGIFVVFLAAALFVWLQGQSHGWSRDSRIMIELCLLSGLLLCLILVKYFEAVTLWVASLHGMRWQQRYDHIRSTKPGNAPIEAGPTAFASLRDRLRSMHGFRWRYRDRWLLVSGDDLLIDRLAPGLRKNGYQPAALSRTRHRSTPQAPADHDEPRSRRHVAHSCSGDPAREDIGYW
jgi:type VI secretion system protein ImpL